MTNSEKQMLSVQRGLRLKALMKENNEKQETIALALGYVKESISRFCTGKQLLPDTAAEVLAKRWDIREEYIKCIDDFKTDLEMLDYTDIQNKEEFIFQKNYLEKLGFKFSIVYSICCSKTDVYEHKSKLLPFLRNDSYNKIISDPDYNLPFSVFKTKHNEENCELFLNRPLTKPFEKEMNSIHKTRRICNDPRMDFDIINVPDTESPFGIRCSVVILFDVYYNNERQGYIGIRTLQQLFKNIDKQTKCTLEIFIENKKSGF